jgi:hypothetical protein
MSALPPKADICGALVDVRFGPKADITGKLLFNQQKPTLPIAVKGIYRVEQPLTRDQPWLVVRVDIEDEYKIFRFKITANRRKMPDAGPEYSLAAKVYDVPASGIIRVTQMLPKFFFAEIA